MRMWRNWQTRMIQVHVGRPVQVQVLLSAPERADEYRLFFLYYNVILKQEDGNGGMYESV